MFDAHFHIIDPRFPLVANNGYLPSPYPLEDYRAATAALPIDGGAVVSGSWQGTDQRHLIAALKQLGPGYVGVAQLKVDATDRDIVALHAAGVRALRFNLKRGALDIAGLSVLAKRAYDLVGWHAEMYVDGSLLPSLEPVMAKLPAVSIDHLGMTSEGIPYLCNLVERGAWVKATGFARCTLDVVATMRRIHTINPAALLFGTDLPGTRAPRPFRASDLELITEAVGGDVAGVFDRNARALYRLPVPATPPRLPDLSEASALPVPRVPANEGRTATKKFSIADLQEFGRPS